MARAGDNNWQVRKVAFTLGKVTLLRLAERGKGDCPKSLILLAPALSLLIINYSSTLLGNGHPSSFEVSFYCIINPVPDAH